MLDRRRFLGVSAGAAVATIGWNQSLGYSGCATAGGAPDNAVEVEAILPGEDIIAWVHRQAGGWDDRVYRGVLGAANEFKEGDQIIGVSAANETSRQRARQLLENTTLRQIDDHPPFRDELQTLLHALPDPVARRQLSETTLAQLKSFLLEKSEAEIESVREGLSSDVIACVVRLMSDAELIAVGGKLFHSLPGSQIGARGYLGARIQPNSPTDHPDDIRWQVLNGFAFAVGDVLLGTNPVSSDPQSVALVERTLQDVLVTFGIEDDLPHCVLAHIDVQAEVERLQPGSTALWFQSIAGNDAANQTFGVTVSGMRDYAAGRQGRFGLYFETGQGADFTNGHAHGTDMVLHESRKYGLARLLKSDVAAALQKSGSTAEPWVHLNDVAGFIGPEVFRSREQLVRCCLEDIVMGKLHGLTIGLDVCSTLHMDVSLDDLEWCLDQIMPANPAYLMALPTRIDPMLGYLTTSFHDHVRLRNKFGFRVNDRMWAFFRQLGVIDTDGLPTEHFGDPQWVYLQYCRRRGDARTDQQILDEGRLQMEDVRKRGVFLAEGHGALPGDPAPELAQQVRHIYDVSRLCIWQEVGDDFARQVPDVRRLSTMSKDRTDYILHPSTGEQLSDAAVTVVADLRDSYAAQYDVQIVISDGLNALAVTTPGHLNVLLPTLRTELTRSGFQTSPVNLLVRSGRVRAGYRIGERLFAGLPGRRAVIHVIGERPGSGHHTLSIYMTLAEGENWAKPGQIDHNITRVVSGIAATALAPEAAAVEAIRILRQVI